MILTLASAIQNSHLDRGRMTNTTKPNGLVPFPFFNIRNISSPDDSSADRKILTGHALAASFVNLPDNENVREYLVSAEGKLRQTPTQVHRAMRDTLENKPSDFSVLNGGIVIVASRVEIDEKEKIAYLENPSIINGSQTQGEIRAYLQTKKEPYPVHVTFEIIETADQGLVAEVSIARNFQNDVARLSIAGRRKQLDELEAQLDGKKLKKSETDRSDDYVDTEKLLQVITALIPPELWPKANEEGNPNKVYTYSIKSKCLRDYQELYVRAKGDPQRQIAPDAKAQELYSFFLHIAPKAYELYNQWKTHQGFKGTALRSIERDEKGNVVNVPDGIIFPILSALSAFVTKVGGTWKLIVPAVFRDEELIRAAKSAYIEIANSNPWNMGKSKACYSQLFQITSIYRRLQDSTGAPARELF